MACSMSPLKVDCKFNTVTFEQGNPAYTGDYPATNSNQAATCPNYMATCASNYLSTIENYFGKTSPNNLIIDDQHFKNLYNLADAIANNRNFVNPRNIPSNIARGNKVHHDDFDTLKLWADSVVGANINVAYRARGSLIDNASFLTLKNKYKEIAALCNTNGFMACPQVCQCNTICTCNCYSVY